MVHKTAPAGYDSDFALWIEDQAATLRAGRWADVDVANLAEEIESLPRRDRREIKSRLTVLMQRLLKLQYQPEQASESWNDTIAEQAREVEAVLDDSPSLRNDMPGFTVKAYANARKEARRETKLPLATFPETPTPEFARSLRSALAGEDFGV